MSIRRFSYLINRSPASWPFTLSAAALIGVFAATPAFAQAELTGEKAKTAEQLRADLSRLAEAQKGFFAKNKTYATDMSALAFTPSAGGSVTISYASARMWHANASHSSILPFVCFVIVNTPEGNSPVEKPFCTDAKRTPGATALANAGPATGAPAAPPAADPKKAAAPPPVVPKQAAPTQTKTEIAVPSPALAAKREAAQQKQIAAAQQGSGTAGTKQAGPPRAVTNSAQANRAPVRPSLGASSSARTPSLPTQGDVQAATRPAGPVANTGAAEPVTMKAFADRLDQIASGAAEIMRAKPPELARDPQESSAEYAARRADAMAAYNRREADYYVRNTRTFVVDLPAKDAKYDPDRELLDIAVDPVVLPTIRSFTAGGGLPALAVNCYTRARFWCSPDEGMTYEPGDLWRVTRAKAREVDVLRTPLTVQARFALGPHEDSRGPALTLIGLELMAKGVSVARWTGSGAAGR